jgi:hypothetical protein
MAGLLKLIKLPLQHSTPLLKQQLNQQLMAKLPSKIKQILQHINSVLKQQPSQQLMAGLLKLIKLPLQHSTPLLKQQHNQQLIAKLPSKIKQTLQHINLALKQQPNQQLISMPIQTNPWTPITNIIQTKPIKTLQYLNASENTLPPLQNFKTMKLVSLAPEKQLCRNPRKLYSNDLSKQFQTTRSFSCNPSPKSQKSSNGFNTETQRMQLSCRLNIWTLLRPTWQTIYTMSKQIF